MHLLKFLLLLVSAGVTLMLGASLLWHIPAAWNAPHVFRATGTVVELLAPPPGDAERVPGSGPRIVVEFKDAQGTLRRETYNSFNSGGATPFARRSVGETFQFELETDRPAPGPDQDAGRRFDWQNAGKVHWALGGTLVFVGALLYFL